MSDVIEGVILQARECSTECSCGEKERQEYYEALLRQLAPKRSQIIRDLVTQGVPRHKARLLAKAAIEEDAKEKAEETARAKAAGSCYLFFDPTAYGRVSLGYEGVDIPVLTGARVLQAMQSLGEFTLQEMQEIIEKGTFSISLPDAPDSFRSFVLHNTTPLRKVYNLVRGSIR